MMVSHKFSFKMFFYSAEILIFLLYRLACMTCESESAKSISCHPSYKHVKTLGQHFFHRVMALGGCGGSSSAWLGRDQL